jgi:DNA repair protein SbcD/Mre11
MFTVFHTADWHLGQSFFGYDRDYEHNHFLEWLLAELQTQKPDALIVAGDVFDSINPSAVAQKRYYNFLARAHSALPHLQMVITAGNHDAGARLESPAELLRSLNVTVVGTVSRNEVGDIDLQKFLVPLTDSHGTVQAIVLAVPYLRPSDVPLISGAADPYLDGIRELYRLITEAALEMKASLRLDVPLIAMGHCHLTGGEECLDSERRLVIGGAEALTVETFHHEIAYVALGHLHKAQQFHEGRIRYSGSPIPLSFAEMKYEHRIMRLTFAGPQLTAVEGVPIPRSAALVTVPETGYGTIDEVLALLQAWTMREEAEDALRDQGLSQSPETNCDLQTSSNPHPFLEVRVLEDRLDPTRRVRIEQALEGKPLRLASIKVENPARKNASLGASGESTMVDLKSINPEEIFLSAHQEKHGTPADEALVKAFREIVLQELHTS